MKSLVFLLLLITISTSCNNDDRNETPVEIPITEYSLVGTSCQWVNLKNNEVIIVNSKSELEKYVNCSTEILPEIDFSKNTLLLACGSNNYGIANIVVNLQQYSSIKYMLNVEIISNDATVIQPWTIGYIANTSVKNAEVELNVTITKK